MAEHSMGENKEISRELENAKVCWKKNRREQRYQPVKIKKNSVQFKIKWGNTHKKTMWACGGGYPGKTREKLFTPRRKKDGE